MRPFGPIAALALAALAAACDRAPAEPPPVAPARVVPPRPPPTAETIARCVAAALDASVADLRPLSVPAPAGATVVGFTSGGIPSAALVDGERAWVGRDGAERALRRWRTEGGTPDAAGLARLVTALLYPGCALWTGAAPGPSDAEALRGVPPALSAHPGGGRVLVFSFVIPAGRPGEGLHVARWRWTDTDLLIEASPHPERR